MQALTIVHDLPFVLFNPPNLGFGGWRICISPLAASCIAFLSGQLTGIAHNTRRDNDHGFRVVGPIMQLVAMEKLPRSALGAS